MTAPDETFSKAGPICPYCSHLHRADEPVFYDEDVCEFDCEHCGREFKMEIYHSTSWTCNPIEERP